MPRRLIGALGAVALQVVALVLAHDVVYLARYGSRYGEALVHAGHGETWSAAVETTLVIGIALVLAGLARLAHLGLLVRRAGPAPATHDLDLRRLLRRWLRTGTRIALVSAVLLTVQENLEQAATFGSMPGPGILLSQEYPSALWITIAIGFSVGLVAALFTWRRDVLLARLRHGRRTTGLRSAAAESPRPHAAHRRPLASTLGRRSGLRAPPLPGVA